MAERYSGQRMKLGLARSGTRTGPCVETESRHGPSPMVNWSSSYTRAAASLEPNVPLVTPEKTSEIAAASMPNNITQASHRASAAQAAHGAPAAARPRWPSTAARSCSAIATFSRTRIGHQLHCPDVEVAGSSLHHPPMGADLRALAHQAR